MVEELRPETNQGFRFWEKFSQESKLVLLSSISLIVSLLALLSVNSISKTVYETNAKVNYELPATKDSMQRQMDQLHEEVDILAMRANHIQVWLDAHGVKIE